MNLSAPFCSGIYILGQPSGQVTVLVFLFSLNGKLSEHSALVLSFTVVSSSLWPACHPRKIPVMVPATLVSACILKDCRWFPALGACRAPRPGCFRSRGSLPSGTSPSCGHAGNFCSLKKCGVNRPKFENRRTKQMRFLLFLVFPLALPFVSL